MLRTALFVLAVAVLVVAQGPRASAQPLDLPADAKELQLTRGLAIDGVGRWSRRSINIDVIAALMAEHGVPSRSVGLPAAGDGVELPPLLRPAPTREGEAPPGALTRAWRDVAADDKGSFSLPGGSYVLVTVMSQSRRVMMLEAAGHSMVYENGVPRMGDPYSMGNLVAPVLIETGQNAFLFAHAGRGPMTARLVAPASDLMIHESSLTTPDLVIGDPDIADLGVSIINATMEFKRCALTVGRSAGGVFTSSFRAPPLSITTVPCIVDATPTEPGEIEVPLRLYSGPANDEGGFAGDPVTDGVLCDEHRVKLRVVGPKQTRRETFLSLIDRSVQYYGVVPPADGSRAPGMVLSLHGASVEAIGQAGSYAAKPGLVIVCPTNRRPFGFDWEDWGRADAMEVLEHAAGIFNVDRTRIYLTGHSMGGHGTWQIGVHYPDRFAALAPSAGWLSFQTYMGPRAADMALPGESPLRAVFESVVRVSDTPALLERLKGKPISILHGDADDNVPVSEARLGRDKLVALGVTPEYHEEPGAGHWWDNDPAPGAACVDWPAFFELFARSRLAAPPPESLATELLDERSMPRGSFKRVFARTFRLCLAPGRDPREAYSILAKTRFDAEQWSYRANGAAEIISDHDALVQPRKDNLIIYGNADQNRAWALVDTGADIEVRDGMVRVGDQTWTGDDLGVLAVAPMKDHPELLVGIVAGSGPAGFRALHRLPYFTSGTGFPGVLVVRSSIWREGLGGVVHAEER